MMLSAIFVLTGMLQQVQGSDLGDWAATIDAAGKQRMLSQRMTKEFLLIAAGMDVEANKVQLGKTMDEFNATLYDLIHGNPARLLYAAPAGSIMRARLSVVEGVWAVFSQVINENLAAASSYNGSVDADVMSKILDAGTGNVKLLSTSNAVVGSMVDAAKASGATVSGLAVDIAGRQRMLIQRMCKEALLIRLNVNVPVNRELLKGTISLFNSAHRGIILGLDFVGIPALENMCTIYQMRDVTYYWDSLKPTLDTIIASEDSANNRAIAIQTIPDIIEKAGTGLFSAMVKAVSLYVKPSFACDPLTDVNPDGTVGINNQGWTYLLNNVGKQRMLGQKASQLFMQIANQIAVQTSKVDMIIITDTIGRHIRSLIEGSRAQNIYAPPTQMILDQLLAAYATWTEMSEGLQNSISLDADQLSAAQVEFVASMSEKILTEVNSAVQLYEDACILVNSTVPARLINDAGRQRMVLMKMAKEAGLVQYGYDKAKYWRRLNETRAFFEEQHWMLLYGDTKAPGIPSTTNVCIIQQMKTAYDRYLELDSWVLKIANGGKKDLWRSAESGRKGLLQESFDAMNTAVGYYANGVSSCDPLSVSPQEWTGVLLGLDKLRATIEQATAQYFSSQQGSGLADLEAVVRKIRFGSGADDIPAPLTQAISDDITKLESEFVALSNAIETSDNREVTAKTDAMIKHAKSLMTFYVDRARKSSSGQSLQISRLTKISEQSVLVHRLLRQAAQVKLYAGATMEDFGSTLAAFEQSHDQLLNGGGGVQAVIEERGDLLEQWDAMDVAWQNFKPLVQGFAQDEGGRGMQTTTRAAENLLSELQNAISLYIKPDPYVPPKPPPFPYTEIIYAIIGTVAPLSFCGVFCYYYQSHPRNDAKDKKSSNQWSDMMGEAGVAGVA